MKYSEERRAAILSKLLPPDSRSVAEVAAEEGVSVPTLYAWLKQARGNGRLLPDHGQDPEGWTSRDKFSAVVETAAMSEIEVAEYCRQRGLYPEQIQRWRRCCEHANERAEAASLREGEVLRQEQAQLSALPDNPPSRPKSGAWSTSARPCTCASMATMTPSRTPRSSAASPLPPH
jgi:transposase-like protein